MVVFEVKFFECEFVVNDGDDEIVFVGVGVVFDYGNVVVVDVGIDY